MTSLTALYLSFKKFLFYKYFTWNLHVQVSNNHPYVILGIILRFTAHKVKCFSENTARYVDIDFTKKKFFFERMHTRQLAFYWKSTWLKCKVESYFECGASVGNLQKRKTESDVVYMTYVVGSENPRLNIFVYK